MVRALFAVAAAEQPSVVFIDEGHVPKAVDAHQVQGVLYRRVGFERGGTARHQTLDGNMFEFSNQPGDAIEHVALGENADQLSVLTVK